MTAPVTFVTGLPGNGKTLYTLCMVKEWAEKENRQVYYYGIEILDKQALPWVELTDPKKWHECPAGAIIVVDEAHKLFPNRPTGSQVPAHVEPIAELRHQGHNLVLITQHPMEIDSAVRRRCGRHLHAVRRFGMQGCTLFEWPKVRENCDKSIKDAIRHEWKYRQEAYAWYKSAEVHTIKRKIPAKVWFLLVVPVVLAAAVWMVVSIFLNQRTGQTVASAVPGVVSVGSGAQGSAAQARPDWWQDQQPRVIGLPHTAPAYDGVTKPVRAPYPAACVYSSRKGCRCYSQQATRMDVPEKLCRDIADGGFFMAWDEQGGQAHAVKAVARPDQAQAQALPVAANLTPSAAIVPPAPTGQAAQDGQALAAARCRGPHCMP